MLGWLAQIAIQFFQEGVVFVSFFLSNFSAFITEPAPRNLLSFKPKQRQCLIPLAEVPHLFQQSPTALPVTEPDLCINFVADLVGSARTHLL